MADDAVWHVVAEGAPRGPLRRSQVLSGLRDGSFSGDTSIWRPGFDKWLPLREVSDFWSPPKGPPGHEPNEGPPETLHQPDVSKKQPDEKWSLWGAAIGGLVLSSVSLCLRALTTDGYRLANVGYLPNAELIGELAGELLVGPLVFVVIAVVRNTVRRRSLRPSSASAIRRAAIFFGIMMAIGVSLNIFGSLYFSRDDVITGEARADIVSSFVKGCFRTQRAAAVNASMTDTQISGYCNCMANALASNLTYRKLGASNALDEIKQNAVAAASSCQPRR